jgi:predicted transcriptional regulator
MESNIETYETKIKELRSLGYSYNQISKEIGCSKSTVSYYLGKDQKEKTRKRTQNLRSQNSLLQKIDHFKSTGLRKNFIKRVNKIKERSDTKLNFNYEDVLLKFGQKPFCHLTGRAIDLENPKSYHLDHIIPKSKGGDSTLDNLAFAIREANQAKSDMFLEDFLDLCELITAIL